MAKRKTTKKAADPVVEETKVEVGIAAETTEYVEVDVALVEAKAAPDLNVMCVAELYNYAKENGIKLDRGLSRHEARKVIQKQQSK
jgi:hypothetical protein